MIDPKREICGVSEVTLEFKKNLRKDAALNEYNKDSGVVVEQKCVCMVVGVRRRPDRKV